MADKPPGNGPTIPERLPISETEADAWTCDDRCQARATAAEHSVQEAQRMMHRPMCTAYLVHLLRAHAHGEVAPGNRAHSARYANCNVMWPDLGSFDNVSLETGEKGQYFVSLGCRYREIFQCGGGMSHEDRPVTGADAQTFVGGLHIAACVEDGTASGLAHEVDDQLTVPSEALSLWPFQNTPTWGSLSSRARRSSVTAAMAS